MLKQLFQCFYDKNFKKNIYGTNKLLIITAGINQENWNVILKLFSVETSDCKKEGLVTKKRERPSFTSVNRPETASNVE